MSSSKNTSSVDSTTNDWLRFCSTLKLYPALGFRLDVSKTLLDAKSFQSAAEAIARAIADMDALEAGEIVNQDEERMVGHLWLRAPERAPSKELTNKISDSLSKLHSFSDDLLGGSIQPEQAKQFKNVLHIGIGGGTHGAQFLHDAFRHHGQVLQFFFIDNIDPDGIARTLGELESELEQTLVIISSKSGTTPEPMNASMMVESLYTARGLSFAKHAVAITCADSALGKRAHAESWLGSFPLWDWVGGRFSLFSAAGLLSAALQGISIDKLLEGAREMDVLTRTRDPKENPAMLLALFWLSETNGNAERALILQPYFDRLLWLSRYMQQLLMESLGKEKDRDGKVVHQGLTVFGNKGSSDQHTFVQQLRDGPADFFVTFIEILSDYSPAQQAHGDIELKPGVRAGDFLNGFLLGTRAALAEQDRHSVSIGFDTFDEKTVGAIVALFERAVSFYASFVNINAYDQPGVQAGKTAAEGVLELQTKVLAALGDEPLSVEAIGESIGATEQCEWIYKILERLSENPNRGVKRQGSSDPREVRYSKG